MQDALLTEVIRNGLVESCHRGTLVLLDSDGSEVVALGDVDAAMYPRSALKPLQATAMVRAGLRLDAQLLALVAASHSGGPEHVVGVDAILQSCGTGRDSLQCIEGLPLGSTERDAFLRAGGVADRIHFNCSGKHAGFIATCVHNGWDPTTYLAQEHPLQVHTRDVVAELCGESPSVVTTDGCGAPLFAVSLRGLARGFRAVATGVAESAERHVADAMRAYPAMVAGVGREDTIAMQIVPGLIAKIGAEGVICLAMPDGRACAIKVSDGAPRGYQPVIRAVLQRWGCSVRDVERLPLASVLGGGVSMGETRMTDDVKRLLAS